ncbi:MAG: hypothetical protein ACE5NN_05815 [Candidatus Bathyarchaeia archaeon]
MSEKGVSIAKRVWINPEKMLRNRKRVTGTVETAGTKKDLYTGAYIARSIIVSNDSNTKVWFEIYDGNEKIIGRREVAGYDTWKVENCWIPFESSIGFNSDVTTTILTCGGFTP